MSDIVPIERIESKILLIRGKKVLLDRDLAKLYEVNTGNLNKAVTRNIDRFPEDFMFTVTKDEFDNLIFQNGTGSSNAIRGTEKPLCCKSKYHYNARFCPYA
jgi:hypothetical protein